MNPSQDYVQKFKAYENQVVALAGPDEQIVGSGWDAVEALADAAKHGFTDPVLYKVFPMNSYYVPTTYAV
jgi:hypothetical protein